MEFRITDEHVRKLSDLLEHLRNEIKICTPVSYVEFRGIQVDPNDHETAMILLHGVGQVGDMFFQGTTSPDVLPPSATVILFGPGNCNTAIDRLSDTSAKLIEVLALFFPKDLLPEINDQPNPLKKSFMTGKLVFEAVRRAREFEPESLALPQIIEGKLWGEENSLNALYFPNGKHAPMDIHHWNQWVSLLKTVGSGTVSMHCLQTPILQSAANVTRFVIDYFGSLPTQREETAKSTPKKRPAFFDSGHDESEGEWCDPMPLVWIAKSINETEEMTKQILSHTGLKQKAREKWIARVDALRSDWSDAIVDAPSKNRPK